MDAEVRDRLRLTTGRLAKRLGIDPPADPDLARNPDLARVYELQTDADFLEALDGAIKDEGYSAAAGESRADMEAADAAADADAASAAADTGKAAKETAPVTKKGKA
jgi:hypothetical protein